MRNRIHVCNWLMRPLKAYIERGESDEHILRLVNVLNQLDDEELVFVMAKYVTLARFRENGKSVYPADATKLRKHLQLKTTEASLLGQRVYTKVYELYFDDLDKQEKLKEEKRQQQMAKLQAAEDERWNEWKKQYFNQA